MPGVEKATLGSQDNSLKQGKAGNSRSLDLFNPKPWGEATNQRHRILQLLCAPHGPRGDPHSFQQMRIHSQRLSSNESHRAGECG